MQILCMNRPLLLVVVILVAATTVVTTAVKGSCKWKLVFPYHTCTYKYYLNIFSDAEEKTRLINQTLLCCHSALRVASAAIQDGGSLPRLSVLNEINIHTGGGA